LYLGTTFSYILFHWYPRFSQIRGLRELYSFHIICICNLSMVTKIHW